MAELPAGVGDLVFRGYAGEDDLAGMATVINAAMRQQGVAYHQTVQDLRNRYRHLTNCDLDNDMVLAERHGEVMGYRRVFWYVEDATCHRIVASVGRTHPSLADETVTAKLLGWADDRIDEIAAERPHDGRTFAQTWVDEADEATTRAVTGSGYVVTETYAEMTRSLLEPIPDHPLPDGLEIRRVTEADRRRVWEADQEAFRDHVGFSRGSEEDFEEFASRPTMDPALWKVAFAGDQIAGQVLNYVDPEENAALGVRRGWTEWISTRRPWRGKGLAKALIVESMRMFGDMGMEEVALGVHTTNPTGALRLYEGLGYTVSSQSFEYRRELA